MFSVWQALTIVLVSVGMALSLAHVLEFPGNDADDRSKIVLYQLRRGYRFE